MFLDESGDASTSPDPRFNIFVLCGIIFREDHYKQFDTAFKTLKAKIFNNESIIFHSYEMRKQKKEFRVFSDKDLQKRFYDEIEKIFRLQQYAIIACVVNKDAYAKKYKDKDQVYEDALKFICERAISYVSRRGKGNSIVFCLEKRGKKDRYLKKYYTSFIKYGTDYCSTEEFQMCNPELYFRGKHQNVNGLEFADLCAFPIAIKELHPERPQPTYELLKDKFYRNFFGKLEGVGLKRFP